MPVSPAAPLLARRIVGVDAARGVALFGMMAAHVFAPLTDDGRPTPSLLIAGGRSAATFVFVAGVSLAFLSGGRTILPRDGRTAAAAGIAVRALLIGLVGLALGLLPEQPAVVILQYYAVMFLLSIPVLGFSPRVLAGLSAGVIVVGPVLLYLLSGLDLPFAGDDYDPGTLVALHDPAGFVVLLFVTGTYPVLAYLAYLYAGLAVGRLDLSSRRVAGYLLGGGLALAVTARLASWILLGPMGGLAQVAAAGGDGDDPAVLSGLLWEGDIGGTWWSLALAAPHSNTPLDLIHTLGSAMAVLGGMLLLTRALPASKVLDAVAAAGSMTLTLYTAHLLLLSTGVLNGEPALLYLLMVMTAAAFAVAWRRRHRWGPMERVVTQAAGRARRAVAGRLEDGAGGAGPSRQTAL
jgi:uncharacterized membrane protein